MNKSIFNNFMMLLKNTVPWWHKSKHVELRWFRGSAGLNGLVMQLCTCSAADELVLLVMWGGLIHSGFSGFYLAKASSTETARMPCLSGPCVSLSC